MQCGDNTSDVPTVTSIKEMPVYTYSEEETPVLVKDIPPGWLNIDGNFMFISQAMQTFNCFTMEKEENICWVESFVGERKHQSCTFVWSSYYQKGKHNGGTLGCA